MVSFFCRFHSLQIRVSRISRLFIALFCVLLSLIFFCFPEVSDLPFSPDEPWVNMSLLEKEKLAWMGSPRIAGERDDETVGYHIRFGKNVRLQRLTYG